MILFIPQIRMHRYMQSTLHFHCSEISCQIISVLSNKLASLLDEPNVNFKKLPYLLCPQSVDGAEPYLSSHLNNICYANVDFSIRVNIMQIARQELCNKSKTQNKTNATHYKQHPGHKNISVQDNLEEQSYIAKASEEIT